MSTTHIRDEALALGYLGNAALADCDLGGSFTTAVWKNISNQLDTR